MKTEHTTENKKPRARIYVGINGANREAFKSEETPTHATHGHRFAHFVGPFRTMRAAIYFVNFGHNIAAADAVAECERLAKEAADRAKIGPKAVPEYEEAIRQGVPAILEAHEPATVAELEAKTRFVYIDGLLCYIAPQQPNTAFVLGRSIAAGMRNTFADSVPLLYGTAPGMRPATREDFAACRVQMPDRFAKQAEQEETAKNAFAAFAHLNTDNDPATLADAIAANYDTTEEGDPRTRATVEALRAVAARRANKIGEVMQRDAQKREADLRARCQELTRTGEERAATFADAKTRRRVALYLAAAVEGWHTTADRCRRALDRSAPGWQAAAPFVNPHTGEPLAAVAHFRALYAARRDSGKTPPEAPAVEFWKAENGAELHAEAERIRAHEKVIAEKIRQTGEADLRAKGLTPVLWKDTHAGAFVYLPAYPHAVGPFTVADPNARTLTNKNGRTFAHYAEELHRREDRPAVAAIIEADPGEPRREFYATPAAKLTRAAHLRHRAKNATTAEADRLRAQAEELTKEADRPRMLRPTTSGSYRPVYVLQIEKRGHDFAAEVIAETTEFCAGFVPFAELIPEEGDGHDLRRLADEIADALPELAERLRLAAHECETRNTPRRATIEAARIRAQADEIERTGDARPYYCNTQGGREEAQRIAKDARRLAAQIEEDDRATMQQDRAALYAKRQANGFAYGTRGEGERLATFGTPYAPLYVTIREYSNGRACIEYHLNDGRGFAYAKGTFAELLAEFAQQIKTKGAEAVAAEIAAECNRRRIEADEVQAARLRRNNGHS